MHRLWIPGPTEVRPEILATCAEGMIGHRAPQMRELIERIDVHLATLFGAEERETSAGSGCAVASCSASGIMEGSLRTLFAPGEGRVLCAVNGAFSKRFVAMADGLGIERHVLDIPWGQAVSPSDLANTLAQEGPFDAVTLCANETSTGVRSDLEALGEVLGQHPGTLWIVDAVTLLAGAPVDVERHGIDLALAGSQKALALPPGLAVFSASERYLERARAQEHRGWYLDLVRTVDGHAARKTPATPVIPLFRALARQLEDIASGTGVDEPGFQARYARHTRMRDRTLAWAASHGLEPFPVERAACSPTVSCLRVPEGSWDAGQLAAGLMEEGLQISNGYGDLKGKTFRIGHMGDHREEDLEHLLGKADRVIEDLGA